MRIGRMALSFILIFALLACTITVLTGALEEDDSFVDLSDEEIFVEPEPDSYIVRGDKGGLASVGASFSPRLTAPAKTNKYYYSDINVFYRYDWGMPNCTAYAWGRAYEILGSEPKLSAYSAYLWYDYNKDNKFYSYGQTPKLGAIACWVYSSGYSGHVAVVEKIEGNTVTYSNSAWGGREFYLSTAPKSDPCDGDKSLIFQGYIYIGNYTSEESTSSSATTTEPGGDVYRITSDNGVNLRKTAGTSGTIIGAIGYGQDVTVTKTTKKNGYTWGYTTYNGKTGWFVLDFAKLIYTKPASSSTTDNKKPQPATTAPTVKPTEKATQKPTAKPTEAPKVEEKPVEREYLMGDVDADGRVSIMDATYMQRVLAELVTPTEYILTVGDYNGDSVFSIFDAGRIQIDLANDVLD